MRTGFLMAGLLLLTAPALAGDAPPRSIYVTMVLQAFAAKVECPNTDLAYQDLVQRAQQMHLPDGTTEKARKAIAWMHTGGKMGEKQDDDLMAEVAVATQATDMDQRRLGMSGWCEAQKTNLAGLIRAKGG
ncbi:hypothetical protein NLM27_14705 [Bradyrhizobium sp. CCGB12]|uniref:hypothetical protein n=1 Tax=Bradyrhizobium sp. CCGB12 TaxID=2949632 RepID=UPI0020B327F9|nr:hypothetical protein [Bradyrhizobium sp. CCGB12]MCP3390027.1 hypothetical protein [Bradyrhizobium sp. CCGB12]